MKKPQKKAQTAIEYMLVLAVIVASVMIAFPKYMPRITNAANTYYNKAASGIVGNGSRCGDGACDQFEIKDNGARCCADCYPGCDP
ncbi:MAG: class III signal peptide-containing protein [Candidatus Omnitrophica bacterium]|nr:class III signal peptide-containing protein [Candidatus Omnitrophota bacterium]